MGDADHAARYSVLRSHGIITVLLGTVNKVCSRHGVRHHTDSPCGEEQYLAG